MQKRKYFIGSPISPKTQNLPWGGGGIFEKIGFSSLNFWASLSVIWTTIGGLLLFLLQEFVYPPHFKASLLATFCMGKFCSVNYTLQGKNQFLRSVLNLHPISFTELKSIITVTKYCPFAPFPHWFYSYYHICPHPCHNTAHRLPRESPSKKSAYTSGC